MHDYLHPTFGIVILVLNVNVLFLDVIVGVLKPVICMGNNCLFQLCCLISSVCDCLMWLKRETHLPCRHQTFLLTISERTQLARQIDSEIRISNQAEVLMLSVCIDSKARHSSLEAEV